MSFPVVFLTQNWAVHSGNPTVSSLYLPTPRWHLLKAHPFLAIHSADEHRMINSFSNTAPYSIFYAFFSFFGWHYGGCEEEINTSILCSITFFRKSCRYEIMWKNIVEPDRPQMTIWRTRIACWITKATNIISEYIKLVAFPLQQWLQERASILRLYAHYLSWWLYRTWI